MAEEEVEMARPAVIVHYEPTYQLKPSEESRCGAPGGHGERPDRGECGAAHRAVVV